MYGGSVRAFHLDSQHRARYWPHEMLATSTHDTKRSGDVRARISVLSEVAALWRPAVERWRRINRTRKREADGRPAPSANDEYLLYQTLVGTWPLQPQDETGLLAYRERMEAYMLKAAREAKIHTGWLSASPEYEAALGQFVRAVLEPREGNLFLSDFVAFHTRIVRFGLWNALSQTLCKLTAPGVPDIYQGDELWDFSLVDPDNRRPVDYALRQRLLDSIRGEAPSGAHGVRELFEDMRDSRCKLYLIWRTLQFRQQCAALFRDGEYLPLRVTGEHALHVCAFARRHTHEIAIVIAPRLYHGLMGDREGLPVGPDVWGDTCVETPGDLVRTAGIRNVLDPQQAGPEPDLQGRLLLGNALSDIPLALLAASAEPLSTRRSRRR
jgi:(1->4)-alpha-D-glucan 1-alpha-D-glucosylmutase